MKSLPKHVFLIKKLLVIELQKYIFFFRLSIRIACSFPLFRKISIPKPDIMKRSIDRHKIRIFCLFQLSIKVQAWISGTSK